MPHPTQLASPAVAGPLLGRPLRRALVAAPFALLPAAALLLAGCASPGRPLPPSLLIPRPATDLIALRAGDQVELHWTTPARTTDGVLLPATGLTAQVCRYAPGTHPATQPSSAHAAAAHPLPAAPCPNVLQLSVRPGPSTATDHLPSNLTSGPHTVFAYRIRILGPTHKTAGPSAPAFVLAGAAPPAIASLTATATRDGVLLRWTPEPDASPQLQVLLDRTLVSSPPPEHPPSTEPAAAASAAQSQAQSARQAGSTAPRASGASALGRPATNARFTAGHGDPGGVLDRTARPGVTYTYTAQRVLTIPLPGAATKPARPSAKTTPGVSSNSASGSNTTGSSPGTASAASTLEIWSSLSQPVPVALPQVFPPETPTGLEASPGPGSIDLSWEPDTGSGIAGYRIYRAVASTNAGLNAGPNAQPSAGWTAQPGTQPSASTAVPGPASSATPPAPAAWQLLNHDLATIPAFRDLTIQPGITYLYRITAVNSAGQESAPGTAVTQTAPAP